MNRNDEFCKKNKNKIIMRKKLLVIVLFVSFFTNCFCQKNGITITSDYWTAGTGSISENGKCSYTWMGELPSKTIFTITYESFIITTYVKGELYDTEKYKVILYNKSKITDDYFQHEWYVAKENTDGKNSVDVKHFILDTYNSCLISYTARPLGMGGSYQTMISLSCSKYHISEMK